MNETEKWQYDALGKKAVEALNKNGFGAVFAENSAEAVKLIMDMINSGEKIGFGGSMTVSGLGIQSLAEKKGAAVLDHNAPGITSEKKRETMVAQQTCDLFIASANAITLEGEILNVDGGGNRVSALTFGPKRALIVAGANKIVQDMQDAFTRVEMCASPRNVHRLGKKTPCAVTGKCEDCASPERICNVYSIMRKRPLGISYTVIIVGEELGY
jgi:L-lactate utilization protein LutB